MIRRLLSRFLRPPAKVQQQVTVLVETLGAEGAWLNARDCRRAAQKDARWVDDAELQRRDRYWASVMREIERQSGYRHQPETKTRKT